MIAIREQVVRAFAALLANLEDEHGDAIIVLRGRDAPISAYPAVIIEEGDERGEEPSYGQLDLTMTLTVYGYISFAADEGDTDNAGPDYEAAKTDLYARILQAVMVDRTLAGLAVDTQFISMTPDIAMEAATQAGMFTIVFEVQYVTATDNPYSQTT